MRGLGLRACALLLALGAATAGAKTKAVPVEVRAPDARHVVWESASHLAEVVRTRGIELAPLLPNPSKPSDGKLVVMAIHEFARLVPATSVLELPFFFRDLPALHRAVDARFGEQLRSAARDGGWELLAIWDEGMELMSGNIPYLQPQVLSGKEFVLLRDDPIAAKNFLALDVWTRRASPATIAELQTECVVSGRSVTAQQIAREQLARVHLDVTMSRHRYVGWVVAMRSDAWRNVDPRQRSALIGALRNMSPWQRERARAEEERTLTALKREGMTAYSLPPETWQRYRQMQPAWESFLPETLSLEERRRLVDIATQSSTSAGGFSDSPAVNPASRRTR